MVSSLHAYWGLLALLAAERLFELRLSRRNASASFARGATEVGRAHYRVMAGFHTAFLVACALEAGALRRPFTPALGWAALAAALLAQGLRYWAIRTLGPRWNTRIIVLPGEIPVTTGPYRSLRHPNYLAVVVEMAAVPLIHGAWLTALLFSLGNALLLRVRIRAEERALGPAYAEAFSARPRFVPGVRHG